MTALVKKSKLLIIDDAEKTWVGWTWKIGAALFSFYFDEVVRARTVGDAVSVITSASRDEIHIWGHGRSGGPLVKGISIPAETFPGHCKTVWFRSCEVFRGESGRKYAQYLADNGVNAAAHLEIIHVWQGGLVGVRAGEKVWWSPDTPSGVWSRLWRPRTVFALRQSIPDWAWSA